MTKRCLDLLVSTFLLITLSPLLIFIGCLIRLTSEGPAIFKQKRLGYQGTIFTIFKFRTMTNESGKKLDMVLNGDPRVTKFGKFLRSTHLDELPQLRNVLKGEMSLVGPRPDPIEIATIKMQRNILYLKTLSVKPGMTGPTQLLGRMWQISNEHAIIEKNIEYIKCKSLLGDLKILFSTIFVVLRRQGI